WYLHARGRDDAGNLSLAAHYAVTVSYTDAILSESRVHAVPHPIRTCPATLRYDLVAPAEEVRLVVLDAAGRLVAELTGGTAAGPNDVAWNCSGLANGLYLLKVSARRQGGKTDTVLKRLALVR
ncbi:MAG: FlgD immunoglobulin-like domain containing protein, partial [bacterium]